MSKIKYCNVCFETEVTNDDPICLDCRMAEEAELQDYLEAFSVSSLEKDVKMCDFCEENPALKHQNLCESCWDIFADCMGEYHEWEGGLTARISEIARMKYNKHH